MCASAVRRVAVAQVALEPIARWAGNPRCRPLFRVAVSAGVGFPTVIPHLPLVRMGLASELAPPGRGTGCCPPPVTREQPRRAEMGGGCRGRVLLSDCQPRGGLDSRQGAEPSCISQRLVASKSTRATPGVSAAKASSG